MKRISFLILILLFICSCPVMAEDVNVNEKVGHLIMNF
jgi:hypothetical protein